MFTIIVEKECGCFKKSTYENNLTFETKAEALAEARLMESQMNQTFCQTHLFYTETEDDAVIIRSEERPKEKSGGCCGGGHCSS